VYELAPGARVRDALEAAGGPTADAAEHELNLAAPLTDGTRMYVPAAGEEVAGPLVVAPAGAGDESPGATGGPVDVNRATVEELVTLPGVGPATATAIVEDRARNGPFAGVEDLDRVPGIGPAKLDALRDLVTT
jgi:competence protein ComEA